MREILLNGKPYQLAPGSTITKRAIYPWKAQVRSVGSREFSDFSQAELEEYHDFRNGIGLESDLPAESARTWWTEGIDFSTARSAVLGPLVNTAPAISDPSTPTITNPGFETGALTPWENFDEIESTETYGGSSYSGEIAHPGAGDQEGYQDLSWDNKFRNVEFIFKMRFKLSNYSTGAGCKIGIEDGQNLTWSDLSTQTGTWVQLTVTKRLAKNATQFQIRCYHNAGEAQTSWWDDATITMEAFGTWTPIKIIDFKGDDASKKTYLIGNDKILKWSGSTFDLKFSMFADPIDAIVATDTTDEYLIVSSATEAVYTINGDDWLTLTGCQGYLAWYDTKLRSIDTDGGTLRSSDANDIDGSWATFNLTGQFGTVFDLFWGKLLTTNEPTLYLCGTGGLWVIDVSAQKAYPQEVEYPPLTYSGHKGLYWNANVWVATGYGILKVASTTATFIGPDQDDGLPSGYQGYIYDMVTVNNWLVFCVNGGTTDRSSILKRNSSLGGNLQVYTGGWHKDADTSNTISASDASDQSTLETLLNEIRGDYNTHRASTTYHIAADSTNDVTSAIASNLATALTLANEIKTDYNAHRSQSGVHLGYDPDNDVTSDDATDLATAITLANEIKADYNVHLASEGGAITCLHHSPSSLYANGRLWFSEGTDVKYMMFPDTTSNVKQISSYEYVDGSGYGKLPILRKLAVIKKVALRVMAVTKSLNDDEKIEIFYGLNGADPTTSLGTFTKSPLPTALKFNNGLGIAFQTIQLAKKLFRGGTNTNSPELESLTLAWYGTPARISAWTFNIEAIGEEADKTFTDFEAILDTDLLVPFYPSGDSEKTSYNVKLTTMPSREWWEEQGAREGFFSVTCEQIFEG